MNELAKALNALNYSEMMRFVDGMLHESEVRVLGGASQRDALAETLADFAEDVIEEKKRMADLEQMAEAATPSKG